MPRSRAASARAQLMPRLWKGRRRPIRGSRLALCSDQLLDDEGRLEIYGPGDIMEIG